ncbi:ABC transporter ATP-binding protein [Roseburia hominis]|uniref:ABC transporter ATP-binding protein n=1 Tax=Roseburia hominis TaxID=301301 RepID=UPI0026F294E4|nr:ATP-binding cassette domain-containing protein [Roseburia hominis]MCI7521989.1 ABC transporter ATP-binding protein [Roseburia hominis]
MIEINHLVKKYGEHVAVDDLTLTVEPGKIYGFLGPNGAGKSTTMNMITGYLGATSGEVKINGHDIFADPQEAKKCVGYLPEIPPLYTEMTVREYLDFVAELKGLDKKVRKTQTEEIMELTHTKEVSERLIRNLSKGYRQRVGFAQAIMGYPDVIILDEPTVGLDPKQIIEVRELIKELGKKHTVILSSHILTEISAVCDHVFILSKGKLVASDSTEHLLERMSGAQEIALLVKDKEQRTEELLKELPGVAEVSREPGEASEEVLFHVTAERGEDIREALFHACAKEEIPVLEMHTETKSLEDVFLELTGVDGKGEQA